jgi:hypothetical protein
MYREADGYTKGLIDIQKGRWIYRETERYMYREAYGYTLHRETDRYTERQMDIQRE